MGGPLSGVRVLALSQFIAGPFGSMILGDMGAEVIKIEPPEPVANRILPGPGHKGESFYHLAFNRNKKSITIDLRTPSGQEAFLDLVSVSDVIFSNYRPQSIVNLKADYETVKLINPRIISSYISGYGLEGPYRDRPSFDINGVAMSGIMSVTGQPDGPPLKPGVPMGDITTGMLGALGTCAALVQRGISGKGQLVDVSLTDSCMSTMAYEYSHYFCSGEVPGPLGNGHLALSPYNAYNTANGWLTIGPSWPRLARVLNMEWMIEDPRFATTAARLENRQEFDRLVQEKLMEAPAKDWLELMHLEDIAAEPVNTLDKTTIDPQINHRNMVLEMEHSLGGKIRVTGNPIKMPGTINEKDFAPPPTLGQHNNQIFGELLGYSSDKIEKIIQEGQTHREELSEHLHKRL